MIYIQKFLALIAVILAVALSNCSHDAGTEKNHISDELKMSRGEESGTELSLDDIYDGVRDGARLILEFDARKNSFIGTVENITDKILKQVRVEVHLSNGIELGPTTPIDLAPGKKTDIVLTTTSRDFVGWTTHSEIGSSEQGHDEREGEHDRDSRSEHKERESH